MHFMKECITTHSTGKEDVHELRQFGKEGKPVLSILYWNIVRKPLTFKKDLWLSNLNESFVYTFVHPQHIIKQIKVKIKLSRALLN
jgi:hypothetical protein